MDSLIEAFSNLIGIRPADAGVRILKRLLYVDGQQSGDAFDVPRPFSVAELAVLTRTDPPAAPPIFGAPKSDRRGAPKRASTRLSHANTRRCTRRRTSIRRPGRAPN